MSRRHSRLRGFTHTVMARRLAGNPWRPSAMLDTRVVMWRTQPMQQHLSAPVTPPSTPPAPGATGDQPPSAPATSTPPVADQALEAPGLRALQAERDANATLRAEIAALKAAAPPAPAPATPPKSAAPDEVGALRTEVAQLRADNALNAAGVRYQLAAADLAIVGTFGSPADITERARVLSERLAVPAGGAISPAAPATPGLPGSPNADQQNPPAASVQTGLDAYAARQARKRGAVPTTA